MVAQGGAAHAMSFALEPHGQGHKVVVARGPVEAGDAGRLKTALLAADRDGNGHKLLVLDSPGGPVAEAFAMAEVMDAERVSTLVRAGASCASSCAMVLFVSGIFRTVERGGRLGIHTCFDRAAGIRADGCNEAVAQAALKRGVPYVSSYTLMHLTPPASVRWLDAAAAACWRLSRPAPPAPGSEPVTADPAVCPPPPAEPAAGAGMTADPRRR